MAQNERSALKGEPNPANTQTRRPRPQMIADGTALDEYIGKRFASTGGRVATIRKSEVAYELWLNVVLPDGGWAYFACQWHYSVLPEEGPISGEHITENDGLCAGLFEQRKAFLDSLPEWWKATVQAEAEAARNEVRQRLARVESGLCFAREFANIQGESRSADVSNAEHEREELGKLLDQINEVFARAERDGPTGDDQLKAYADASKAIEAWIIAGAHKLRAIGRRTLTFAREWPRYGEIAEEKPRAPQDGAAEKQIQVERSNMDAIQKPSHVRRHRRGRTKMSPAEIAERAREDRKRAELWQRKHADRTYSSKSEMDDALGLKPGTTHDSVERHRKSEAAFERKRLGNR